MIVMMAMAFVAVAAQTSASGPISAPEKPVSVQPTIQIAGPIGAVQGTQGSVQPVEPQQLQAAPTVAIPVMTPVLLQITTDINSKTAKIGEMFPIKLAGPIAIDGKLVVDQGITGQGEVVHAAKARAAGKAGELILAARYLDWNGTRIPLRTFKYGPETGESRVTEAVGAAVVIAAPVALFIAGGEKQVPAGTMATAKVSADVFIPALPSAPLVQPAMVAPVTVSIQTPPSQ